MATARLSRGPVAWTALIVGIAAAGLTAWGSWIPSMWGDEAATVLSATRSLSSLWTMVRHLDAMHATYYLVMHFWIDAFGASAFSVRFPSAIAVGVGAAGLVVLMRMFRRNIWIAVLAGGVFAALPRMQYIGEEARSFAWDAALVTWTMIAFVAAAQRRIPQRWAWVLYAVGLTVATWMFPYDISVIGITGLVLLIGRQWRMLAPWGIASAAALVASSPVLGLSYLERGQVAYLANTPLTEPEVVVETWFGNPIFATVAWVLIGVALAAVVWQWRAARVAARAAASAGAADIVAGAPATARAAPREREAAPAHLLLIVWAFLPGVVLVATEPLIHNYAERYLAFCAPAAAALIAEGIGVLGARFRVVGFVAAACVVAVAIPAALHQRTPYSENGSDWGQVASYIHERAHPGEDVLFAATPSPSKKPMNSLRLYPADYRGLKNVGLTTPWYRSATTWHDISRTIPQSVAAGLVTSSTIWVVEARDSHSEGLPQLRAAGYHVLTQRHFDLDTVYQLAR